MQKCSVGGVGWVEGLVLCLFILLAACGGGRHQDDGLPLVNIAPVANAGAIQNVFVGSSVILDASASTDANADALTYQWSLASKPAGSAASLSSSNSVKPRFVADLAGRYVFSLVVNDGKADSMAVTVTITAAVLNLAPVANAGNMQNVYTNTYVTLDGSASTDANDDTLTYAWTFISIPEGSNAVLSNASTVGPNFIADKAGSYTASLIVSDAKLSSVAAMVTITAAVLNVAPVANAGTVQSVTTGTVVTLDGSNSSDANGDSLIYTWSLSSKPAGSSATISDVAAVKPGFIADKAGNYVAQLIVYDGKVTSNPMTVTVTAVVANVAPVANAGTAQSVVAGDTVFLDGSPSFDANDDVLDYAWMLVSKPAGSSAILSSNTAQKPHFTADVAGTYVAQLVVSDGKLSSGSPSRVTITASFPAIGYSKLDANGLPLADSAVNWSCVRDNVTKLVWEVKNTIDPSHLRYYRNSYTNYDDADVTQIFAYSIPHFVKPSLAQIHAASNSVGFKMAVNAVGFCGSSDWRVPNNQELAGLMSGSSAPYINTAYFPDVDLSGLCDFACYGVFLSSSPSVPGNDADASNGWSVDFQYQTIDVVGRTFYTGAIRLVRTAL